MENWTHAHEYIHTHIYTQYSLPSPFHTLFTHDTYHHWHLYVGSYLYMSLLSNYYDDETGIVCSKSYSLGLEQELENFVQEILNSVYWTIQYLEISTLLLQQKDIFKVNMQMSGCSHIAVKLCWQTRWTLAALRVAVCWARTCTTPWH